MHIHNRPRPIYFTRHGESMFNVEDKVGGNPDLSERGYAYTIKLNQFFQEEMKQRNINKNTKMFCSTLQRTIKTAGAIDVGLKATRLKMLDEIHSGSFDGMTYSEISKLYPNDAQERAADKLRYRYPNGESYVDVIQRIEPVIFAIEKSKEPIIIVTLFNKSILINCRLRIKQLSGVYMPISASQILRRFLIFQFLFIQ